MSLRRRILLGLIAVPTLGLLVVVAVAGWLLFTESGSRWVIDQVPGLELEGYQGTLGGGWQAGQLVYDDGAGTRAVVAEPVMDWSPGCLVRMRVCIEQLEAEAVTVSLPEGEEGEDSDDTGSAIELPAVQLPVSVSVAELDVGRITFNDSLILERIESGARLEGSRLRLETLSVKREALVASAAGSLEMTGDWPVDLALDVRYDTGTSHPGELALEADLAGTVADLDVGARMSRPWQARLEGSVRPLQPGFPARARLTADRFRATPELPEHYALGDLVLRAEGNLDEGWSVKGDAGLETDPGLDVALRGHTTVSDARIDSLDVSGGGGRSLSLAGGRVSWSDGLRASGSLDWHYFPWQRLVPDLPAIPVAVSDAGLDFELVDDEYTGQLDAQTFTREGPVWVRTPVAGDFSSARMDGLSLASGLGRVAGDVGVGWSEGVSWQADLALENLLPGRRLPQLDGRLSGSLTSEGRMADDGPEGDTALELAGSLRGQAFWLDSRATLAGAEWQVPALEMRFGDNRVQGKARQDEELTAELEWSLPALEQLWQGLEGRIEGRASGRNLLAEPRGTLELSGEALTLADYGIALSELSGTGKLDDDGSAEARLDFSEIEAQEQRLESGQFRLDGTLAEHELGLSLLHRDGSMRLSATGAWNESGWQAMFNGAGLRMPGQHWLMTTPARLSVARDGEVRLGAHCWNWDSARLCTGDQRFSPEPSLHIAVADLPTRAFRPWLPGAFRWEETIDAFAELELGSEGPRGRAWVDAGAGEVALRRGVDPDNLDERVDEQEEGEAWQWVPFGYDRLRLAATLEPGETRVTADVAGPEVGTLDLDADLQPMVDGMPVAGRVQLDELDLALIRPFLDLDTVEGRIGGDLDFNGPLASPSAQGEVALTRGELRDPRLPLPLSELTARARIDGTRARIDGDWRSGEEGRGRVEGEAGWDGAPEAEVSLVAEALPVTVPPYAELSVFPDLMLQYGDEGVAITGDVRVPSGDIGIQSLPESAVGVSRDAVVEGEEEAAQPLPMALDLEVLIGGEEDRKVDFNGFGVTGNLEGRLNLADDMMANGELNLRNGRYELYGQDLSMRQATLLFSGPVDRPYLDIEAVRTVEEVTAGIRLTGPADEPRAEVFSEPSMSQQQALSYLTLGRPLESEGDSYAMERAAINLGLARTAPMTREIGERVGIEDLQLETEGEGEEASVVASGYLTDRLSVRYGVGLFQPVSRLALRYDLTRSLYLEAASGLASSLDLFYRTDFGKPGD